MHIDFAPPSNGTYNNAGSSRQLANYLEHEDLERMEKGIYTEGFFNLTDDNIYESKVIKDIDTNIDDENIKAVDGSRVRLRLLDDVEIGECVIARGTYQIGRATRLNSSHRT